MLEIIKQTIDFYMKNLKKPKISDLNFEDKSLLGRRISCFVTIYHKGIIRGASGNIKEIKENLVEELIENTIEALTNDKRFKKITLGESKELNIRVDEIISREILKDGKLEKIEPTSSGVLVIKKDYEKMACILPNIDPKILSGEDYINILLEKLGEKNFNPDDYIIYEIKTKTKTNY